MGPKKITKIPEEEKSKKPVKNDSAASAQNEPVNKKRENKLEAKQGVLTFERNLKKTGNTKKKQE